MFKGRIAVTASAVLVSLFMTTGIAPAIAKDAGDIMVRVRGLLFLPDESGAANDGNVMIGGEATVDDTVLPEIDFTYFFTKNIAAELILATTRHSVGVARSSLGDVDLGEVSLLPPTLTLQYHPMPDSKYSPYVGAGINYTIFYNADRGRGGGGVAVTDIDFSDNFGYVLQAGIDIQLADRWYFNADVKKVFLSTDINLNNGLVKADDVDLDPWIVGVGFGYRF